MNLWGDNKEGRPVDDCRIIEQLRALDSDAASLFHYARELACVANRITENIEALYKWDMKDNVISDTKEKEAVKESFLNATSARARSHLSNENVKKIMKKFGFVIKGGISPLDIHMATEE